MEQRKHMPDIMLSGTPIDQRARVLNDSCDQILERHYTRKFSQEEVAEKQRQLADASIRVNALTEELKSIKTDFQGRIKPLEERKKDVIEELKAGGEFIKGEVYKFVDVEIGKVGLYSPEGYLLEERDLNPEERQRTIMQVGRTGSFD